MTMIHPAVPAHLSPTAAPAGEVKWSVIGFIATSALLICAVLKQLNPARFAAQMALPLEHQKDLMK